MNNLYQKLLFFTLLLLPFSAFPQNRTIDSLRALLPTKSGSDYIDITFELARAYGDVDRTMCFKYGDEAHRRALQSGDTSRIVKTGRIKAQGLRRLGELDSALVLFADMLRIARRHNLADERKTILNAMGTAHMILAHQDKALECFFESLALSELDNDKFRMGVTLNNIGLIYLDLADYKKAMTYLKKSLFMKDISRERYDLEGVLINLALCSARQNNLEEGNKYLRRAHSICKENCSTEKLEHMHNVSGILLFMEGNLSDAENAFLKSKSLNAVFRNDKVTFSNLSYLLTISLKRNQPTKAQQYLNEIESLIASGVRYNFEIINIYPQVFSYYLKLKNYEKAAFYQNKYFLLKDSIYDKKLTINLMKIEAEHLEKENLVKIESQNKILALNKEVIRTQKFLNIFIGIVALLLVVLIIVLIKSNRLKQKHNILLDKKVQERTHQLQLNHDSLQRASQERDILLQKISSDINNALVTLKGLCSLGMKDIQDPHALEYISKMNTTSESFSKILTKLHLIRSGAGILK
jgi:tetratricopeptide (TPR) repeat protein